MASVIISNVFNSNIYIQSVATHNYISGIKLTYKIKDLKEFPYQINKKLN